MKTIKDLIKETEKGCGRDFNHPRFGLIICGMLGSTLPLCIVCQAKLSTLKSCQAKFDKLKELLKQKKCHGINFIGETEECFEREWNECLDELSQREGDEE